MATEWHHFSIGDLCDAGIIQLQTGPFGSQLHAHDYVQKGIPVVPTEAIANRCIDHSVLPEVSQEKASELSRHRLRKGDILFARRGVQATGHIGYVRDAEDGFLCGTGAIRLRVTDRACEVSPEFLSHVFANPQSVEWFKFHAIGATMPNLNEGIIRSFSLLLPPLQEQLAITRILSALDDKIALNRRIDETLEAMASAVFKSWFIDFDPVRNKAEGHHSFGIGTEIEAIFPQAFQDSPLGSIPTGWQVHTLADILEITGGGTPTTSVSEYWNGDIPWFSVVDTPPAGEVFAIETEKKITKRGLESCSARLLPVGTTIISARGTVGQLALVGVPMAMNQSCYGLRGLNGLGDYFTYFALRRLVAELARSTHGTVFDTITRDTFRNITTAIPPVSLARCFDDHISRFMKRILLSLQESRTLVTIRDSLLPRLVSGEFHLREFKGTLS